MADPVLRLAPGMTLAEALYFQDLLLRQAAAASGPLDVFEYGAGGSTVYFPEFLRGRGVPFSWVAAEHSPHWAAVVRAHLAEAGLGEDAVRVKLIDPADFNPKEEAHRDFPMGGYVAYPLSLGRRFDVVFVDGRRRRRCLAVAGRVLAPGGVVVLHDAGRAYYACGFDGYRHGQFAPGTTFWEGRLPSP